MSSSKMITLKSSDGEIFEVEEAAAMKSQMIKHMIEDNCADGTIPVANVTGETLAKVLQYCKRHADADADDSNNSDEYSELKNFDAEFVEVDQDTLYNLIIAANFLNIKSLMDLVCQTVADMIKGKTPAEIRKILNIENDFTPEEEEQMRRENPWVFEERFKP